MKFSQVEFTAVLASVLRRMKIDVVVDEDDKDDALEKANARVLDVLKDSVAEPLLLHVREPEKLSMRMVEREL